VPLTDCHHGVVRGTLAIAATPIGNPRDASPRLLEVLATANAVAAEDTRRLARLARQLHVRVSGDIVSFYEAVEQTRTPQLLQRLDQGQTVALVSDAGMPAVSDPGYRLTASAAAAGHRITVIPGPSAVLAALVVSGLPSDRFCFEGFPPRKAGERRRWLMGLASEARTAVFFESPRRLAATLTEAVAVLGPDRPAVVCRELTKTYEEVRRGTLAELAGWAADGPRGEITVVLAGAAADGGTGCPAQWAEAVASAEAAGAPRKEAMKSVAEQFGVPKREVFDAVIAARREP
jgi:16S rRNA (cytidine1402-2'-O)-methyltransferase